jgi:phage-related protein
MSPSHKPLVWLGLELKSPPLSHNARLEAGFLLRQLQKGISLEMPQSRPMPVIGSNCHELRIQDEGLIWRIFYRIDRHAIVLIDALAKKTPTTPKPTIDLCIARLKRYDHESN